MTEVSAVFPLSQAFLPGEWVSLRIFEDRYLRMVEDIRRGSKDLCSVLIERGSEVGGGDVRLSHGVRLEVEQIGEDATGLHIGCRAGSILSIVEWLDPDPYPCALTKEQTVSTLDDAEHATAAAMLLDTMSVCRDLMESLEASADMRDQVMRALDALSTGLISLSIGDTAEETLWKTFWLTSRMVPCGPLDRYSLLEPGSLTDRTGRLRSIIDHVRELLRFGSLS